MTFAAMGQSAEPFAFDFPTKLVKGYVEPSAWKRLGPRLFERGGVRVQAIRHGDGWRYLPVFQVRQAPSGWICGPNGCRPGR